jgi:GNAT superfamily N-acetyltransferase
MCAILGQVIRRATPEDAATVGELLHVFNVEFGSPTPTAEEIARRWDPERFPTLLAGDGPDGFAVLTFRASLYYDGPTALLEELYVRPPLRGRGIGRELLRAVIALARERGAGVLELNTGESDTAARRLYESEGLSNTEDHEDDPLLYYQREL